MLTSRNKFAPLLLQAVPVLSPVDKSYRPLTGRTVLSKLFVSVHSLLNPPLVTGMSLAQTLPAEIITSVFWFLVEDSEPEFGHGGHYIQWDSNEIVRSAAQVCVGWSEAANVVLYHSITILGKESSELFLETARGRPDMIDRVRYLVLGLGKAVENEEDEDGHRVGTKKLLEVLACCQKVEHLQIRPIHAGARDTVVPILSNLRSLITLVHSVKAFPTWSIGVIQTEDLPSILVPSLRRLDLDFASPLDPPASIPGAFNVPVVPLSVLHLRIDILEQDLCVLLKGAGRALEVLNIYSETPFGPLHLADAILSSKDSLRVLKLVSNPSADTTPPSVTSGPPLASRLLPQLTSIHEVMISSTEISAKTLEVLPRTLQYLTITEYTDQGGFLPNHVFFDTLENRSTNFTLRTLKVRDSKLVWTQALVSRATAACAQRGIRFVFVADEDASDIDD